jgi:2-oxoisovalerate dehydrogenase E2 component (dihydrolipoyl transacylase)
MSERVIKLPDIGEGVAEAEIVEVPVKVGDPVREGDVLAAVMTDKATVEIPAPVDGRVLKISLELGQKIAVGSELMTLETDSAVHEGRDRNDPRDTVDPEQAIGPGLDKASKPAGVSGSSADKPATATSPAAQAARAIEWNGSSKPTERPLAAPAVRAHALNAGVDLSFVKGSGPAGRILHQDVDAYIARADKGLLAPTGPVLNTAIEEIKVVGLRRKIAQRMQDTKRRVPHFSYIEEIDVTDLEALRANVNGSRKEGRPRLTPLPFLMQALVLALREHPQMNARFDDKSDTLYRHGGIHIGIAIQTPNGLVVAVVRHAEARSIWDCASEVQRLSDAARSGTARREELTGSTITITSLGASGGLATTPVINMPEVAIIGVNKIAIRPVWQGAAFEPRKIMNLSSSFDHRIIDGWEAAQFIQHLRSLLETPAKILMET